MCSFPLKQRTCRSFTCAILELFFCVYFNIKHKISIIYRGRKGYYMPQFYMIDIYNISIIIKAETESEKYFIEVFRKEIETERITVERICKWCILHHIQYGIKFKYYKYPINTIGKNIKYLIKYIRMKKRLNKFRKIY